MAEYELDRERFKELKHFCYQYPKWKKTLSDEPLEDRVDIERAMLLIEKTALDTSRKYAEWILKHATYGLTYSQMRVPCDNYAFSYYMHKFYWLLDKRKGY